MASTARQFLDLLEMRGVLPPVQMDSLRRQVDESPTPIAPHLIARRLVERGYVSAYHAKNLLAEAAQLAADKSDSPATAAAGGFQLSLSDEDLAAQAEFITGRSSPTGEVDADLGLAELDDESQHRQADQQWKAAGEDLDPQQLGPPLQSLENLFADPLAPDPLTVARGRRLEPLKKKRQGLPPLVWIFVGMVLLVLAWIVIDMVAAAIWSE